MSGFNRIYADFSLASLSAGFVAILVGYTSSAAIIFQAANAFGATPAQLASWMWALGIGMGLCTLLPSFLLKQPIICAWSTPGAAVLATSSIGGAPFDMPTAIGAFMVSALLITLAGLTGWFEKLMSRIPIALANALLAGVLARFGMDGFKAASLDLWLVLCMFLSYLVMKRFLPRYAIPITLFIAGVWSFTWGQIDLAAFHWELATPIWVEPRFTWSACISLAIPLFIVTMASQNLPGVAAIHACGYRAPISKLISMTGFASLLLAPFGGFAINLAAITATICMGPQAHDDANKRYTAGITAGILYIIIGLFGTLVATALIALPKAMIACIAGLALLGTIGTSLNTALSTEKHREAALITFLVVLSGVQIAGIGAAFWALVAGILTMLISRIAQKTTL